MFVDLWIECSFSEHAGAFRDDRPGTYRLDVIEQGMAVIGFVGKDMSRLQAVDERQRMACVAGLTCGEEEAQRPAQAIDGDVPFARQSSSGAPQSRVLDPPFVPVAAWA